MIRFFDCLFAAVALIVFSPLLIVISILILIVMGRPIFFCQRRVGLNTKLFWFYKFRTMRISDNFDPKQDVARTTRLGHYLRKLSLDELPQLWNVLRGDMSLVGPRPLLEEYIPHYSKEQARRHEVLPGITGWAQINGRNNLNWQEKFKLDVWYVDHRSIILYWRIIFLTVLRVLKSSDINQSNGITMEKFTGNNSSSDNGAELSTIASTWPLFTQSEINAASEVLKSGKINYWTSNDCQQFEQAFADMVGCPYAIAVANGSLALELALYALNIEAGDEVIVPARSFIASASSVVMRQAVPVFADIELDSQNISAATIRPLITDKTRAIIVVHLAGLACDMQPILALAREFNLKVIEDCAQAHGASYQGQKLGSFGDVAAFSFCQNKIMTTGGEGGMVLMRDKQYYERAWSFKEHGKSLAKLSEAASPGFRWLCDSFGTNFRMTAMQAAIGLEQLKRLPQMLAIRQRNASILQEALKNYPGVSFWQEQPDYQHAYYMFYFFLEPKALKQGLTRDDVIQQLLEQNIPCFFGSCSEIYREVCFQERGYTPSKRLPNAKCLGETSVMLLVDPSLSESMMRTYAERISNVLQRCLTDISDDD